MKRRFSPITNLVALLLAAALLGGGAWSIASAAEGAQPGDAFYPLKTLLQKAAVVDSPVTALDDVPGDVVDDGDVDDVDDGDAGSGNDGGDGN